MITYISPGLVNHVNTANIKLLHVKRHIFDSGEIQDIISNPEQLEGQSLTFIADFSQDSAILQSLMLANGFVDLGITHLNLFIPYMSYSTMDREAFAGEVVKYKHLARLISSIRKPSMGLNLTVVDPHSDQAPFYFEGDTRVTVISPDNFIKHTIHKIGAKEIVLASPDTGRYKTTKRNATKLKIDSTSLTKTRVNDEVKTTLSNDVHIKGKAVLIYDDMIRSGKTIINAIESFRHQEPTSVSVAATHGAFTSIEVVEKIYDLTEGNLYITNTTPAVYRTEKIHIYNIFDQVFV